MCLLNVDCYLHLNLLVVWEVSALFGCVYCMKNVIFISMCLLHEVCYLHLDMFIVWKLLYVILQRVCYLHCLLYDNFKLDFVKYLESVIFIWMFVERRALSSFKRVCCLENFIFINFVCLLSVECYLHLDMFILNG